MVRLRSALTAAAAAALCFVGIPSAHASDQLTVRYVGSVSDDLGTLQVNAYAGSDITALTAHIISPTTHQEVAVLEPDDWVLYSGTARDGVWRTEQPAQLPELGGYQVDLEATDSGGDHVLLTDAGSLSYYAVAEFPEFAAGSTTIDADHRDVTVHGVLKGRMPGTRELAAMPDRSVAINVDWLSVTTVTTDDEGRFSATVHLDNEAQIQAVYSYDGAYPGYVYGESDTLQIGISKIPTRYILQTSSQRINQGQSVTLTGRLEKQTATGWEPLAGVSGGILFGPSTDYTDLVGGFTTAADGSFSVTYTPWQTGFFQVAHQSEDPFVSDGNAQSSTVTVLQPSRFLDFTAGRTDRRTVHAEGHIGFDNFTPATIKIALQYSPDGKSWTTLQSVEASWDGMGYGFAADLSTKCPGYFRAYFDGGDGFESITSDSVHVGR